MEDLTFLGGFSSFKVSRAVRGSVLPVFFFFLGVKSGDNKKSLRLQCSSKCLYMGWYRLFFFFFCGSQTLSSSLAGIKMFLHGCLWKFVSNAPTAQWEEPDLFSS